MDYPATFQFEADPKIANWRPWVDYKLRACCRNDSTSRVARGSQDVPLSMHSTCVS